MTGFSDPIYAEAYVHVNQFDILLDLLIVNQTDDTLQNVTLELATLGSFLQTKLLKLISRKKRKFSLSKLSSISRCCAT